MMTKALELSSGDSVLEIGTGTGYQAAILSVLTPKGQVVKMERGSALAHKDCGLLQELESHNIIVKQTVASVGCPYEG